ncbi:MAG: hypothetical protein P3W97_005025 [Tepidimonas sp.]|uniref:hypothetical protein n=1 Tax=Tepidimonas sp. TaxID=2002775 RepID=UPI00259E369A|nr:hypothetical protein [Tepidimonas sp.]MDM7456615.1 hypothetical protein [Tepidimonas sp.]
MSREARALIETFSAAEHGQRAQTFRRQAGRGQLAWEAPHLRQGLCQSAVVIMRHARREFGIDGDDAQAEQTYVLMSQRVIEMGKHVAVQLHRGRLQYVFGSRVLGAVAVVDWESASLRGLYGHRSAPDAFERAWANRCARNGARIAVKESKRWNRLIRSIRWH